MGTFKTHSDAWQLATALWGKQDCGECFEFTDVTYIYKQNLHYYANCLLSKAAIRFIWWAII